MKQKDLLIFDIDGTLTDSVSVHQKAFKKALTQFGFTDYDENWETYEHHTDSFIFKTILEKKTGRDISVGDIEAFEEQVTKFLEEDTCQNPVTEIGGANTFFQTLSYEHFDIVFATGSLFKPALLKLTQSGLIFHKALIVSSNSFFSREDIVSNAISVAKDYYKTQHYRRIFSFGDGRWDYETAENLELVFIGIGNERLLQSGAKYYFKDFADSGAVTLISNALVPDFPLNTVDAISSAFTLRSIGNFSKATQFIRNLPYGRNSDKLNLQTVFTDNRGTCSTKHALLYKLAKENGKDGIKLFIGLYKMNPVNTPSVAGILRKHGLNYIPEAHCYLKIDEEVLDVTRSYAKPGDFLPDLLEEIEIIPEQISSYKIIYHKSYLEKWLNGNTSIPYSLDELWEIREQCIMALALNAEKSIMS